VRWLGWLYGAVVIACSIAYVSEVSDPISIFIYPPRFDGADRPQLGLWRGRNLRSSTKMKTNLKVCIMIDNPTLFGRVSLCIEQPRSRNAIYMEQNKPPLW
jgi:hypothetical protein